MSSAYDVSASTWDVEVVQSEIPVVVDFWAPWCGPCRMVAPELDKLAARSGDTVKFVKVNVDDNRELAMEFDVMSIPTIAKFERGAMTARVTGARGAEDLNRDLGLGV